MLGFKEPQNVLEGEGRRQSSARWGQRCCTRLVSKDSFGKGGPNDNTKLRPEGVPVSAPGLRASRKPSRIAPPPAGHSGPGWPRCRAASAWMAPLSVLLRPGVQAWRGRHGVRRRAQGRRPREAVAGRRVQTGGDRAGTAPGTPTAATAPADPAAGRGEPLRVLSSRGFVPRGLGGAGSRGPGPTWSETRGRASRTRAQAKAAGARWGLWPGWVADPACRAESASLSSFSLPGSESGVSGFVVLPMYAWS